MRGFIITKGFISLKTKLTNDIELNIPILSAAMDTVTESEMAISLASAGGIGIIHKNNSIEEQVALVKKVKKYESGVVRDPIACKPAVMAESEHYVAFGSEYRALVNLPNIENAKVWEPEPETVYFWNH